MVNGVLAIETRCSSQRTRDFYLCLLDTTKKCPIWRATSYSSSDRTRATSRDPNSTAFPAGVVCPTARNSAPHRLADIPRLPIPDLMIFHLADKLVAINLSDDVFGGCIPRRGSDRQAACLVA
jgi:hypothetical protein